jgi:hypothetical protein
LSIFENLFRVCVKVNSYLKYQTTRAGGGGAAAAVAVAVAVAVAETAAAAVV